MHAGQPKVCSIIRRQILTLLREHQESFSAARIPLLAREVDVEVLFLHPTEQRYPLRKNTIAFKIVGCDRSGRL